MSIIYINPFQFAAAGPAFLLDDYPGAAAAYSLRQLRTGVTNVVRVRRDNDNAEDDFTATDVSNGTLAAWVGAGNNGFVRTWYDQSGNANDAGQTTAAKQPKIVDASGGLLSENGKAALSFNGTNTFLTNSTLSGSSSNVLALSLSKIDSTTTNQLILSSAFGAHQQFDNKTYVYASAGGYYASSNSTQRLVVSVFDGSLIGDSQRLKAYDDTVQKSLTFFSGTVPSSVSGTGLAIGRPTGLNTAYFLGKMQETIIYLSDQSANRAAIEADINAHYSIYP